ncbi:hypothetical protein KC328_g50 [Hortaea werneckii]|nr:hypothetical protein KC328_g50 [Hortaea werneckii]
MVLKRKLSSHSGYSAFMYTSPHRVTDTALTQSRPHAVPPSQTLNPLSSREHITTSATGNWIIVNAKLVQPASGGLNTVGAIRTPA